MQTRSPRVRVIVEFDGELLVNVVCQLNADHLECRVNELSRLVLINLNSRIVWNWGRLSRQKFAKTLFENTY
jgi:hypothetical protein